MQDIIFPKHKKDIIESLHSRARPLHEIEPNSGGKRSKKYGQYTKIIGAVVLVFVALWAVVSYVARAEVIITPHQEPISFNDVLVASRASSTPKDAIGFHVMTVKDSAMGTVPATSKQSVTTKATGTVTLYNTTVNAQKLVARTRLEAPGGKLYRITQDVTIPGAKTVSGKLVPGSKNVQTEAALPGADYNIGLADFSIPGFKGSAKYTKFYGRSVTKMDGGFIGDRLIASESSLTEARTNLKSKLADSLAKKAVEAIPPGWLMYKDGTFLDLAETQGEKAAESTTPGSVTLSESGTLMAIILNEEDMLAYAINHKLSTSNTNSYHASGLESLTFSISNRGSFSIKDSETFTFSLKGTSTLTADIPVEKLSEELVGIAYSDRAKVLSKYSGVQTAEIKLHPGFLRSLPSSKDRITIRINPKN